MKCFALQVLDSREIIHLALFHHHKKFFLRGDLFCVWPCLVLFFFLVFFSHFSIAITSQGEEKAYLSDFKRLFYFC